MSEEDYKKLFSKKLKYFMELNSKNQSDLVNYMNVSSSTASDWCNGKKMPRMDKIQSLCNWLGIEKSDLLEDKPTTDYSVTLNSKLSLLIETAKKLNTNSLNRLEKYASKLYDIQQDEYMLNAAHAIEESSESDKKHDEDIMDDENF